ncbi:hypothetical protein EXN54_19375 [Clostridium botulinum]|uniref:Uncharacterized protein n=1 Tax=Clostridium botulinum (strain Kyoto / Type A2) TaxID=536232 RepID=C1FMC3_CLOBJ|nr:hypothetical protein [Clostridium botulinum]ACO83966.1 conserved hypothetical protein [Clostridium botulinum A2 str. Kyoto]MBN3376175.1 hypothetical protein [Clostridium botulinum]MBN3403528.1 hypothetical protein [Clostridium botulinum]MBN3449101.1 hypothetical protein [Clostridium botulinum]NEZ84015.1 hypothetical protein [Clostridium botulinum]
MSKAKKIALEDFIKKATDKYNKRKRVVDIEVEGFGILTFTRPSDSDLLEFKNTLANSIKMSKDESIDKLDYRQMLNASKELIYNSCEFLHSNELMQDLECGEPFDIPIKVFGIDGTIQLAQKINEAFEDSNVETVIKNS